MLQLSEKINQEMAGGTRHNLYRSQPSVRGVPAAKIG